MILLGSRRVKRDLTPFACNKLLNKPGRLCKLVRAFYLQFVDLICRSIMRKKKWFESFLFKYTYIVRYLFKHTVDQLIKSTCG